jgi:uncharacterized protein YegP (UPF0339 family)
MKVKYKITVYLDGNQEYRWNAKRNGRIVAESGEGYKRKAGLKKTLNHFITGMAESSFMVNDAK